MKLLMTLVVGVVLGAAGYWWLERTAPEANVEPSSGAAPIAADRNAASSAPVAASTPAAAPAPMVASAPVADVAPASMPVATTPTQSPDAAPPGSGLLIPVQGISPNQLQDTFTDARSEGRVHDAIDILAPTLHTGCGSC